MTVRVATLAYPIEEPSSFDTFADKQRALVADATGSGARLLVLPEYASVELSSTLPAAISGELRRELRALQPLRAAIDQLYAELAREHGAYILAPSFPELMPDSGLFHNRARFHGPNRTSGLVEKLQMTRFEREDWGISGAAGTRVFETELGVIGAAICYDSEFPLIVRRQVLLGAEIVLVPSCTDTLAGYHRVMLSCRARALENQCYVVMAPTVGDAPSSLALDHNHGAAAVYGPVDYGFASDGVIASGDLDQPGWVFADLDLDALRRVRETGQVTNHADWGNVGHLSGAIERVKL
ncbi:MAG TPA: carbon-nitrogen hydrolase family protein [Polyangiales bacterium]|nr:carbon-nitrogen hydrolase family protein [Polyangiales bacterium]